MGVISARKSSRARSLSPYRLWPQRDAAIMVSNLTLLMSMPACCRTITSKLALWAAFGTLASAKSGATISSARVRSICSPDRCPMGT